MSEEIDDAVTPETAPGTVKHDVPMSAELRAAIALDWGPAPRIPHPAGPEGRSTWAAHRAAVSAALPGRGVVVPAGQLKTRANDTEYPFRADSAFTWLTGETAADAVLVLAPRDGDHDATLYVREYVAPGQLGYFTDRMYGALWVGGVPTVDETADVLGLTACPLSDLAAAVGDLPDPVVSRGVDPDVDRLLPGASDQEFGRIVDELRLVKTDWEIERLRFACEATARGFTDVARELPMLLERGGERGERWLEGTFWRRARYEGNEVGYGTIVGAGAHGTVLHWWRDNGDIVPGQLLLADMGIETEELYTADVTRTMPVTGEWTDAQLKVYRAVLEAQEAGIAEVRADADFQAAHRAAMYVLAEHLHSWGILPVTADESCAEDVEKPGAGLHRRYTLHGTSHSLGIDVHDCARARAEEYTRGALAPGHVLTVEPGLYFQEHDLTVPPEFRGLAVRIEDDVLVTTGAPDVLSRQLPREPDEVTAWMRDAQSSPAVP